MNRSSAFLDLKDSARIPEGLPHWGQPERDALMHLVEKQSQAWIRDWEPVPGGGRDSMLGSPTILVCEATSDSALVSQIASLKWRSATVNLAADELYWSFSAEQPQAGQAGEPFSQTVAEKSAACPQSILHELLFSESPGSAALLSKASIAVELAQAAWRDLLVRLTSVDAPSVSQSSMRTITSSDTQVSVEKLLRPWSGALHVQLGWRRQTLHLLYPLEAVQRLIGTVPGSTFNTAATVKTPSHPLASLRTALDEHPVVIGAELNPIEIDLGVLMSMQPGDVLFSSHPLSEPVNIVSMFNEDPQTRKVFCGAFLGQQSGQRAIELLQVASPI